MTTSSLELTWWGSSGVSVHTAEHDLIIDPMLPAGHPDEYEYVLVSREDHDHMHSDSLRRLTASPKFERLFAPECCTVAASYDVPNYPPDDELQFVPVDRLTIVEPLYPRKGGEPAEGAVTSLRLGDLRVEITESSEREWVAGSTMRAFGKQLLPDDGTLWPAGYGDFAAKTLPTVGYFIEADGLGIWHPGAMQMNYDGLAALSGRVDVMLLPLVSLLGAELPVLHTVRPRIVIPIQYRAVGSAPPSVDLDGFTSIDVNLGWPLEGAGAEAFRAEARALIASDWHRSLPDPDRRIAQLRELIEPLGIRLVELAPGTPFTITGENR